MRPLAVLSIATAKRFIHSCWASLRVAVASLMVMDLSWAAAPPGKVAMSAAARKNAPARTPDRAVMEKLVFIDSPRDSARAAAVQHLQPHPEERAPKSGLPDFGTQRRIEIGNSRFRLRASRRMDARYGLAAILRDGHPRGRPPQDEV